MRTQAAEDIRVQFWRLVLDRNSHGHHERRCVLVLHILSDARCLSHADMMCTHGVQTFRPLGENLCTPHVWAPRAPGPARLKNMSLGVFEIVMCTTLDSTVLSRLRTLSTTSTRRTPARCPSGSRRRRTRLAYLCDSSTRCSGPSDTAVGLVRAGRAPLCTGLRRSGGSMQWTPNSGSAPTWVA